ncbi:925_t:CDS:1, partial [Funneliformis mosseae]
GSFSTKVLQNNYHFIKELILEKKFIPFPPRPTSLRLTFGPNPHNQIIVPDEYAPKDGYENDGKLDIIGGAIAIEPKLVKTMGENRIRLDL